MKYEIHYQKGGQAYAWKRKVCFLLQPETWDEIESTRNTKISTLVEVRFI
jgi:hypothetical protein